MKFPRSLPVIVATAALLTAATFPVQRPTEKLYSVDVDPVSFGVVQVQVDEEVNQRAPSDFANMSGLLSGAADRCVNRTGSGATFKSYVDLGYQVKWNRAGQSTDPVPWIADPFEGLPNGVDTALVTAVKVLDWRTFTVKDPDTKIEKNGAKVSLVITTRARNGTEILSQHVTSTVMEGLNGESVEVSPNHGLMTDWFLRSDGRPQNDLLPKDRKVLFEKAVDDAMCMHFFPFMPHTIYDGLTIQGGKEVKVAVEMAKAGNYDGAIAELEKWAAAEPDEDTAIYDIGAIWYMRGDYVKAREYFEKANAIKKTGLTTGYISAIDFRDKMMKSFTTK